MTDMIEIIKKGGVGVLPTDTIYGLVGSALNKETVERIYTLKKRDNKKAFVILIGDIKDLDLFSVKKSDKLKDYWPGKVSIILSCLNDKFTYLHRGLNSLAFRLPEKESLRKLLKETGPLVAPSCNPEGMNPASSIKEVKTYFPFLDFYIDEGEIKGKPSKLIKIENNKVTILRDA